MNEQSIYEKYTSELKEALNLFLKEKNDNNVDSEKKKDNISKLVDRIYKSQYAVEEDLAGEREKNLFLQVIHANNQLPKRDRTEIWACYKDRTNIDEPIFDLMKKDGLIMSYYEKPLQYGINPMDKGLNKIMENIVADKSLRDLRPLMGGIHINENSAIGTDAHKLVHINGKRYGSFKDGTYKTIEQLKDDYNSFQKIEPNKYTFNEYEKEFNEIEGIYPKYMSVIPNEPYNTINFNIPIVYSLLKNLIANNFMNLVTFMFRMNVLDSENNKVEIGLNAELFSDVLKSLLQVGMKDAQLCFDSPNKAMLITKQGLNWEAYTKDSVLKNESFGLAMPIFLHNVGTDVPVVSLDKEGGVELVLGKNKSNITKSDMFNLKGKTKSEPIVKKNTSKPTSESQNYLKDKIEAFELLLEIETDKKQIEYLKDKIEAFQIMNDL
jgi:hypothetical protein